MALLSEKSRSERARGKVTDDRVDEFKLEFPSDPRYLAMMRAVVAAAVETAGFREDERRKIVLGLCEAASNVIEHCYGGDTTCRLRVRCRVHPDRLEIFLRDFGPKPDAQCLELREVEQLRPGGLGLHVIRQTMDEVEYDLSPAVGTELRLVKYRCPAPGPEALKSERRGGAG